MNSSWARSSRLFDLLGAFTLLGAGLITSAQDGNFEFNDAHFHLTNYIQEGADIREFLRIMGTKANRVALFGIPLQQQWSFRVDEDHAPTYYLNTDAPLYYYSFDRRLDRNGIQVLAPGAARPLRSHDYPASTLPTCTPQITFAGCSGPFFQAYSRHRRVHDSQGVRVVQKSQVKSPACKTPRLTEILDFAAEAGLVVLIHNDIDVPFAKEGSTPAHLEQTKAVFKRHPRRYHHLGPYRHGRVVRPIKDHAVHIDQILGDPKFSHVYFDISWDEVAKYIVSNPEATRITADLINRYPRPFPVRYRRGGAAGPVPVREGVLPVRTSLEVTLWGGEPKRSARKLRADLSTSPAPGEKLGEQPT